MARFPSALANPPSLRRKPALDSCDIIAVSLSNVKVSIRLGVCKMKASAKLRVNDGKTSTKRDIQ